MKAWVVREWGPPEAMQYEDFEEGLRPEQMVRVKVHSTGVNFFEGLLLEGRYQVRPELPFIPGTEGSGVVIEAPAGSTVKSGERVAFLGEIGRGSYGELVDVDPRWVVPIPDSMSFEEGAALLVTHLTAHLALHSRGRVGAGETVLVHAGAGGVGSAAVQLAKAAGATVIATAGTASKLDLCRALGADLTINYHEENFVAAVKQATGGRGADVIIDPVGGETFERSTKAIAFGGRLLPVGFTSGTIGTAAVNHILLKSYAVVGVHLNLQMAVAPAEVLAAAGEVLALFEEGRLRPLVSATHPISEAPAALRSVISGVTTGKVVLNHQPRAANA